MPDMLCSLVGLPPVRPLLDDLATQGIGIRRPNPWEQTKLREFILEHFSPEWADESRVAFTHQPVTAFVAMREKEILGFSCYECTRRDYFGPTGVTEASRGLGIGKALFLAALYGLQDLGYAYAIIGGAGPVGFYEKTVGAQVITYNNGRGIYDLTEDLRFRV